MKHFFIILFVVSIMLASTAVRAQDSLLLLTTLSGERACASAGDVNGDGFKDIITGNPAGKGYVKIYLGGVEFDTIPDLKIIGDGGAYGATVACAGDLNGDGYDDIIVGARSAYGKHYGTGAGKAYIYFGGNPVDSTADLVMQDSRVFFRYGSTVCSAGDVNNNGYDDVMVAAPEGMTARGRVYLYFGAEEMDSIYDVQIKGQLGTGEHLGRAIANVGDINSDGYDDIMISSPFIEAPWGAGKVLIFLGGDPVDTIPDITIWGDSTEFQRLGLKLASGGDLNGDTVPDILISNEKKTKVFFGSFPMDTSSYLILPVGKSISSAGDLNQDGHEDIIACDDKAKQSCYIFYGGKDLDAKPDIIIQPEDTTVTGFGIGVTGLGDINGDGYDEVMISSEGNGLYYGIVFIYTSAPATNEE
ncbi:MAG: VCBS repeat-containing protein [Candidatus Zixiibacteriota bacterium]